jgi:hypothetical protein
VWRFVKHWKSRKWPRNPVHSVHFSRNSRENISGVFGTQLSRGKISGKGVFSTFFGKNFHFFAFIGWSRRPHFTWGENLNFAFFERVCGTWFRFFGSDFVFLLLGKFRPDEKRRRLRLPIGPLLRRGGRGLLTLFFCSDSRLAEWRQKKKSEQVLQSLLYRIWKWWGESMWRGLRFRKRVSSILS